MQMPSTLPAKTEHNIRYYTITYYYSTTYNLGLWKHSDCDCLQAYKWSREHLTVVGQNPRPPELESASSRSLLYACKYLMWHC